MVLFVAYAFYYKNVFSYNSLFACAALQVGGVALMRHGKLDAIANSPSASGARAFSMRGMDGVRRRVGEGRRAVILRKSDKFSQSQTPSHPGPRAGPRQCLQSRQTTQ